MKSLPVTQVPSSVRLRIQSLASGSSGNAYILQTDSAAVLIDCGIGSRELHRCLASWEMTPGDLNGVVLTHEHGDHVRSLGTVLSRQVPVYATRGTADALGLAHDQYTRIVWNQTITIGSLAITPIQTSHDAAEPCGLMLQSRGFSIALITDLGVTTNSTLEYASTSDLLIIESNHCHQMLQSGPYPAHLKRRVASNLGHLSNDQCADLISGAISASSGPNHVWLAHLSATNNSAQIASAATLHRLASGRAQPIVNVLPRGRQGPIWIESLARARQLRMAIDVG